MTGVTEKCDQKYDLLAILTKKTIQYNVGPYAYPFASR